MNTTVAARFVVLSAFFALGCDDHHGDHSGDHSPNTDHHEHEHGHGHEAVSTASITLWSDRFELFAEHPAAIVGRETGFLIHLTDLRDFSPVENARVTLELAGPGKMRGETTTALRPGIFRIDVTPTVTGEYSGSLHINRADEAIGTVSGISVRVFASDEESQAVPAETEDESAITFLKEQQWRVPFATEYAKTGSVQATVQVAGRISTPPAGAAEVGAPVAGRLVEPRGGLPPPGSQVRKGQLLASLVPTPSSPERASQAILAIAEAEARASAAKKAFERAQRLLKDEAISQREFEDAEREQRIAIQSVLAAKRSAAFYRGTSGRERWRLRAPKSGTLVEANATAGAAVAQGAMLFRIIDTRQLWIVARVPEQDAARLHPDRNAAYQVAGLEKWRPIILSGNTKNASVVMVGKTVDSITRTVDVIYALAGREPALRVGGLVQVALPTGKEFTGVVIPRSAILRQQGQAMAFVQIDGEHFVGRSVQLGPTSGDRVGIRQGIRPGERIVTKGAQLIHLAERAVAEPAHGHIH